MPTIQRVCINQIFWLAYGMIFDDTLLKGKLVKRYKRFFAEIILDNKETVIAHCANSGSMLSVSKPSAEVWVSRATNPNRKLKYTLELIKIENSLVGVNTNLPNRLVSEAIYQGKISELDGYDSLQREVKYGENSRIDILLKNPDGAECYVEVKSVTMRRKIEKNYPAEFPDSVTKRGQKHLIELSKMVLMGHRGVMLYLIQRNDSDYFSIARDIDPEYGLEYDKAKEIGVETIAYDCNISPQFISINNKIKEI